MPLIASRPLILGHRGSPRLAPENTLAGFRRALRAGADGVELDVQRSADGVPVVIHDETLERTTDGRGPVANHPWATLRELSAGGEPIPSLEEAVRWATESGAWVNVELKCPGVEEAVLEILRRSGSVERCFLSSFHPEVVAELGRVAPAVRRFFLAEEWGLEVEVTVREVGAMGVCLDDAAATPEALRQLRQRRLPVVVWTVDDPARIHALVREGVAAVITNRPEHSGAALAGREHDPRADLPPDGYPHAGENE